MKITIVTMWWVFPHINGMVHCDFIITQSSGCTGKNQRYYGPYNNSYIILSHFSLNSTVSDNSLSDWHQYRGVITLQILQNTIVMVSNFCCGNLNFHVYVKLLISLPCPSNKHHRSSKWAVLLELCSYADIFRPCMVTAPIYCLYSHSMNFRQFMCYSSDLP